MSAEREFKPTIRKEFVGDNGDKIVVHVQNDHAYRWALEVNGDISPPPSYYSGISMHKGWYYTTAIVLGHLPVETPFQVVPAKKVVK